MNAFLALMNWKKGFGFVQNNLQQNCENLPQNDRALAYEIALGTCRALADLDEKLQSLMRTLPQEPIRTVLEISLYQLLYTRVPPYAVVNSAAELARQLAVDERGVKFVNGVLRNAIRKNFTKTEGKAPSQWIRVNTQKTTIIELITNLGLQNPQTLFDKFILLSSNAAGSSSATRASGASGATGGALKNPLFKNGFYSFQNPASFFMAAMCEIKRGHKVLDACAAPGGKTAMLAEENPDAFFVCADNSIKRVAKLTDLQNRLGLKNVHIIIANAENMPFSQKFDCVIADAPCSNMGVANRRPEVLQNVSKEKIEALAVKQLAVLLGLSLFVKNGGVLIYCVCSQEKQETTDVIDKFLENGGFTKEETVFTKAPDVDEFFIAKLRKIAT